MNRCSGPPRARAELTAMTVNPQTASQRRKRRTGASPLRRKSDEDAEGQPNRLLMALREGDAVARVHEPAELPFLPRPDHEFEGRLRAELAGTTPRRPNTGSNSTFFDRSNECLNNRSKSQSAWPRLSKNGVSPASIIK